MVGTRLSHFEITAKIGEGGMGEVYQATDTKLNRQVALKILPESFSQNAERMARFSREAQLLASLNHPNIATIHGLEETNGTRALVMELVEGEDLAERISRGPIPLKEALPIAFQIAEALEDAHEKGIILGTAAYMSPEQARGKAVGRRADIWAFGIVLFEMLTGRQVFHGEDLSLTLAAVIKEKPDWEKLPKETPVRIQRLIRRSLKKMLGSDFVTFGMPKFCWKRWQNGAAIEPN